MNVPILFGENLVTLPSARIAKCDVAALQNSAELLARAQRIRDETQAASEEARIQGYEAGKQAAAKEFAGALSEALTTLADEFERENARRNDEVAQAATEVIYQLIGRREADDVVTGLAVQALARLGAGETECVVEVAPDLVEVVRANMGNAEQNLRIESNGDLGPMGCRVRAGEGVIIADLDTQLETLRQRWGLSAPLSGQA